MPHMMKTLALATALVAGSNAQVAVCDRKDAPDGRTALITQLNWYDDVTPIEGCNQAEQCQTWSLGSCQFGFCFSTNDCVAISYDQFPTAYRLIEQYCKPDDLGGNHPYTFGYFEVINYRGPSFAVASGSNPVIEERMSIDEYRERFGGIGAPDKSTADGNAKRQDVTWTNYVSQLGVPKSGLTYQVTQEIDSGQELTWSEATSVSISVSATAGVSASFFEIFSASLEITTSYEETNTITEQLTFTSGDCPGAAIVYWDPLFDKYTGAFSDDPDTTVEIWVARQFNGQAEGRFRTDCIGSS